MTAKLLMLKDHPVAEIVGFNVQILDYAHLPYSLRREDLNFDHIFHGWTESRVLSLSRSNAKKILAGFRMRQNNAYEIAALMHFATLTDCYWIKDAGEAVEWKDVDLFSSSLSKEVADTALFGKNLLFTGKIVTPESSTQGLAAKAWYKDENGQLFLYKIGRKELAAAEILQKLKISHVPYYDASGDLQKMADAEHIAKIRDARESLVKAPIITNHDRSIVTWNDYCENCEANGIDEYRLVSRLRLYHEMQVADYILGNSDRHGDNWGFFMDNDSGELRGLHPLFDHDHAFSTEKDLISQTSREPMTLKDAAFHSLRLLKKLDLQNVLLMKKPDALTNAEWQGVQERVDDLICAKDTRTETYDTIAEERPTCTDDPSR